MSFIAFHGKISTPVSGNAELRSLRILSTCAQQLEIEGVKPISRSPDRYVFKGGWGTKFYYHKPSFVNPISSGEISVGRAGDRLVIAYRIYFDELALVIFGVGAFFVMISLGSCFIPLLIAALGFFLLLAAITIIRFHRYLLACLKETLA